MPIYKNYITYNHFSKKIATLLQTLSLLLITSCSNADYLQKNMFFTSTKDKCQLNKLIIPRGMKIPNKNKNYDVPYTKDDINKKKYSIFPPV